MVRQDDRRFTANPNIAEFACVLFVYLYFGNKLANYPLGATEILSLINLFAKNSWITPAMDVQQPDDILEYLGVKESSSVTAEGPDYQCQEDEYELCMWGYTDANGKWWEHAIAGDGKGNQAYDPLGLSHCGRLGKIVTKRIIHVAA